MRMRIRTAGLLAAALFVWSGGAREVCAQGLTGQISGSVVDGSGSVLPGATVTVQNVGTQAVRDVVTDANGEFVITELLAGRYDVTVTMQGFKAHSERGVVLSANERVPLRPITLEVGAVAETVSVTAEAARVQTQSGERSGLISQEQLENIALKGRDYIGMLKLVPGVVDTANREAPGWNNLVNLSINGGRTNTINLTYDGVTNLDTGSNTGPFLAPGLDSIAEIKVLTSNYQAEYGRSSGGTINVVTKSGTRDFHGGGFYSKRDDSLNANEWQNNKFMRPKPPYKFDYWGYHVGGPIVLPNFNRERSKLFFFWNQEFLPRTNPGMLERRTMPTELERRGDFSQSLDTNGRLIVIRDPVTNAPFPNNIIPADRIDPNGQALLALFPVPNATDPARQYNYTFQSSYDQPRNDQVLRVDWNVAPRTTFYSRLNFGYEAYKGGWGFVLNNANWPQLPIAYEINSYGIVNTLLHTFNPTTVMEVTVGLNHGKQTVEPLTPADLDRNDRTKVGLSGLPQFFPEANPDRIVPNANFGAAGLALANLPQLGVEGRYPFFGENDIWNTSANLTKVVGSHNLKAGIFFEYTTRPAARSSQFNGTFNFNRDTNNPLDTNHPFSNALIGSVQSYSEATVHPDANAQFANVEWFIQDNWRVSRTLTVDAGVRFYRIGPTKSRGDQLAVFQPALFNPAAAPVLIQPISTPAGRRGVNPLTGEILPAVKIGTFAPGSGDLDNGIQLFDEGVLERPPIQVAPRVGFSWDVAGDGKTAVRGGFGLFPDRFNDDVILQLVEVPPLVNTPTANYTTIRELLATPLSLSPANTRFLDPNYDPQYTYNFSIGVQRDIGWKLVADASYVGSRGRNQSQLNNLNAIPYGTNFQASSIDPTTGGALPNAFLRPYRGYLDILVSEFAGRTDYDALQTQVTRRYTAGFQFGMAYTLSRTKLISGNPFNNIPTVNPLLDPLVRNFSEFGRRHNLAISYSYQIPGVSRYWDSGIARAIFDGWEVSGVTSALSGSTVLTGLGGGNPGLTYTIQGITDLTGGVGAGVDSRVDFVCDPNLSRGDRTDLRAFRTECVAPPAAATNRVGTAVGDELIGPGYLNWDIAFLKNIPLGGTRRLQFRCELYNAFNNVQFATVNNSAVFNQAGEQVNAQFGQYLSARDARRIQLTLRAQF
jgi:Carboxypeptidase regulatory-like domain/TonB-dependent Receptor Plug Domain